MLSEMEKTKPCNRRNAHDVTVKLKPIHMLRNDCARRADNVLNAALWVA